MVPELFTETKAIDGVIVRPAVRYKDARGWLMEFFRDDEIPAALKPAMGYLSLTTRGVSRGPHEHLDQSDYFFFPGPGEFLLVVWDNREASVTYRQRMSFVVGASQPAAAIIPPRVVHAYSSIGAEDGVVINVPNRLYRGWGKKEAVDEVRHEDDPRSPFRLDLERLLKERYP